MPIFFGAILGVPAVGIGLIEGIADALASFLRIFSGWWSDKTGRRKPIAVLGYALAVATRPFLSIATSFIHIFGIRLVDRIGKGIRESPRDALLASSVPSTDFGKSFNIQRGMDALGDMLGPIAAFLILPLIFYDYRMLFLIAFGVGVLAILSFIFVKEIRRNDGNPPPRLNFSILKEHKQFSLFLASIFFFGLGTLTLILILLRPLELNLVLYIPLFYFLHGFAFTVCAVPLGKLSDAVGERFVIAGGFLVVLLAYLSFAFAGSFMGIVGAIVLLGASGAATDGIERSLAAKLIGPSLLATGEGLLNASIGISSLIAGAVGGLIWTVFSSQVAFLYVAGISFLGLMLFLLLTKNQKVQ